MDDRLGTTIADIAHVATGFFVLGAQQAQVRRRELQKHLEPRLREAARHLAAMHAAAMAEHHAADQRTER